jgi:hypothetical protein
MQSNTESTVLVVTSQAVFRIKFVPKFTLGKLLKVSNSIMAQKRIIHRFIEARNKENNKISNEELLINMGRDPVFFYLI